MFTGVDNSRTFHPGLARPTQRSCADSASCRTMGRSNASRRIAAQSSLFRLRRVVGAVMTLTRSQAFEFDAGRAADLDNYVFRILINLAGTPPTIAEATTSLATPAPAPTTAPSPMITPFRMVALAPTQTLLPIFISSRS